MAGSHVVTGATPGAGVLSDVYTVPASDGSYVPRFDLSCVVACNRGEKCLIRLSVAPLGAADAAGQYLVYDYPLKKGETLSVDFDMTLVGTDVVRAYSSSGQVDFRTVGEAGV